MSRIASALFALALLAPTAALADEDALYELLEDFAEETELAEDAEVAVVFAEKLADTPNMSMNDLMLMLTSLNQAVTEAQAEGARQDIKDNQAQTQAPHDERIEKIREAHEAMADAKESSRLGSVFGWVAIVATVVAAAAMATSGHPALLVLAMQMMLAALS